MNFKVGVVSKGKLTGEIVEETKRALQEIALKHKCRFELSLGEEGSSEEKNVRTESNLKAHLKNKSDKNGVFLSFGGEIEID